MITDSIAKLLILRHDMMPNKIGDEETKHTPLELTSPGNANSKFTTHKQEQKNTNLAVANMVRTWNHPSPTLPTTPTLSATADEGLPSGGPSHTLRGGSREAFQPLFFPS